MVTRKLQHPNAVHVDDFDTTEDGRPFIVMEYVEGQDLRKVIEERGALPIPRALEIARQVASALAAAHALGITHRDIKPDNILIVKQPDGKDLAKVLDFGIAKVREGAHDMAAGYTATKTGVVVGTPQYMSPEQAMGKSGEAIDGRSDIYSLGCVVYEMVTGKLPFDSETPVGLLIAHIQKAPTPPTEARPDLKIPESLSYALLKSLEKKREDRFQTAGEFMAALDEAKKASTMRMGVAQQNSDDADSTEVMGSHSGGRMFSGGAKRKTPPPPRRSAPFEPAPTAIAPARPRPLPAAAASAPRMQRMAPPPQPSRQWIWVVLLILIIAAGVGTEEYFRHGREAEAAATAAVNLPPTDAAIKDEVQKAIENSPIKDSLQITVSNGVVILGGTAKSDFDANMVFAAAKSSRGVKDVINQIKVEAAAVVQDVPPKEKPAAARPVVAARPAVVRATRDSGRARELVGLGNRQVDAGDYAAAIASFQGALAVDPGNNEAAAGLRRASQAKQTEEDVLRRRK